MTWVGEVVVVLGLVWSVSRGARMHASGSCSPSWARWDTPGTILAVACVPIAVRLIAGGVR